MSKLAIFSFILALLSLVGNIVIVLAYGGVFDQYKIFPLVEIFFGWIFIITIFGGFVIFPLLGLIFGILSRKEKLGRIGIILSLFGLISGIWIYWMALKISWG